MMLKLYSLKDEHNGFAPPVPYPNDEIAKRWFKELRQDNLTVKITPEDFSIWYIGEFSTETGEIFENTPKLIERG